MGNLVILHSTIDGTEIQVLAKLAADDQAETGLTPWVDAPRTGTRNVGTLGGEDRIDPQIARAIQGADAILYAVGDTGAGRYQSATEADLVKSTIEARKALGRPLKFVPVLLQDGRDCDLADWMRGYTIVNKNHADRTLPALWESIKQRLMVAPEDAAPVADVKPPDWQQHVDRIIRSLRNPRQLTVFIGPYSLENPGNPAAIAKHLLELVGIDANELPILPWPSEAAQWAMLSDPQPDMIRDAWSRLLAPLGLDPPELALNVAELARRWIEVNGDGEDEGDWNGLLLITTRTDLSIESALSRIAGIGFTRILPSLNDAAEVGLRRKAVQQWEPKPSWVPVPSGAKAPQTDDGPSESGELGTFPLDTAKRVVLVKLCGTVDIPDSLILTPRDFFIHEQNFESLPPRIVEVIRNSAQLVVGRGFASPLAQLIQLRVLKHVTRGRLWVVSEKPDRGVDKLSPVDALCDLETEILDKFELKVMNALNVTDIYRGSEAQFVRRLAAAL